MKAVEMGIQELMVGSVQSDDFHKDGTEKFYSLLDSLMGFQEGNIKISAPAIHLSTIDLILASKILPEILYFAHSCHKSDTPCGHCKGCYKYIGIIQKLKDADWEKS
jgi:7-cyano-7-deazaguanine synthase